MTVGERIYYCRTENHMTQKELGEKTGIASATIGKYERGVLNPKVSTLRKIAEGIGCKVSDLDESLADRSEIANAALENAIPDLQSHAKQWMESLYGTSNADEAHKVVYSRWFDSLSKAEKRSVMDAVKHLQKLNAEGKSVAADRVEELTQIPKYQLAQSTPQDVPAGQDDKEPTEK